LLVLLPLRPYYLKRHQNDGGISGSALIISGIINLHPEAFREFLSQMAQRRSV
jgi:hypothetical protein